MSAKYQWVYQELDKLIHSMKPGSKLPAEKLLAQDFNVSPMTVRRALTMLIDEQRIQGIPGKGTFVCRQTPIKKNAAIPSFSEVLTKAGKIPSSRLLLAGLTLANDHDQEKFDLPENSHIFVIRRIRLADGEPVCLEESHISPQVMPDLLTKDLTGSLYQIFANDYQLPVANSNYSIRARLASAEETELLHLDQPGACLEVHSQTYSANGVLLEIGHSIYRGDLYEFTI